MEDIKRDDLWIICKSILDFLREAPLVSYFPTPKQDIMNDVLSRYNLDMTLFTHQMEEKYGNKETPFFDKSNSAKPYFDKEARNLYAKILASIRDEKIDEILN